MSFEKDGYSQTALTYGFPIKELKAQLEQARIADKDLKQFGANTHEYHWNPPASLEEVEQFEQKIGVSLPEEYRNFLLQAGNGGAGPFYGLFSLEEIEYWLTWDIEPDKLPILCPEQVNKDLYIETENWMRGCIPIESQGDTYFTYLLVTGPNHGRIVYVEYEGSWVFFPKEPNFLCWYQRWLREVCNHYNISWFATNIDGDEQELQEYYKQAKTEEEKRSIIHSFDKFPVFSQNATDFLKTVISERMDMQNAKEFLLVIYRISSDFFYCFLEKRWQAGYYNTVVSEVWYAQWYIRQEREHIIQKWYAAIFEKLPQISEDAQVLAVNILQQSKAVKLEQVRWVLDKVKKIGNKINLLHHFSHFVDAEENLDIWLLLLDEREDLELLKEAIITVPIVNDQRLKDSIFRIQNDFSFAVELIIHTDYHDKEAIKRSIHRQEENAVYRSACLKWKEIWKEEINPKVVGIPRPYFLKMNHWDIVNLFLDKTIPENGIAVHPMIALEIRNQFHRLPSTAYDWKKIFGKMKKLSLTLYHATVRHWDDEERTAEIYAPDEYPPPKPFYYCMDDWSAIGLMKNLKTLTISQICVDDFSFLTQCQSLERLSLYNTNFSDCRLLLQIPKLKSVDLRLCRLEHTEVLDFALFTYQLNDSKEII